LLKIEYVKPETLIPDKGSPNEMDKEQLLSLRRSIEAFGNIQPILARKKDRVIIGGHHRLKAYKNGKIPVIFIDKKPDGKQYSDEDIKLLNLALNEIHGANNQNRLESRLTHLVELGADLTLTGLDSAVLQPYLEQGQELLTDSDEVPEPEEVYVKEGEVWELGNHRLMCGDALTTAMGELYFGVKIDMVFTDPPYGLGGYAGRSGKHRPVQNDDKDPMIYYECIPIVEDSYLWGNYKILNKIKLVPRDVIVWVKNNFGMGLGYRGQYELCFYYGKFNGSDSDVWKIDKDIEYQHPTQKPVELAIRAIKNSNPKTVLDLYGGSGSTLIACEQTNRKCYMVEIDPYYCQVIIERWQNATGKEAKRG